MSRVYKATERDRLAAMWHLAVVKSDTGMSCDLTAATIKSRYENLIVRSRVTEAAADLFWQPYLKVGKTSVPISVSQQCRGKDPRNS